MRVVVIGINYPPEVAGIAPQTAALCRHLAARGDDVLMLTARPHYPAWRVSCGYRGQKFIRETLVGVRVLRLPSYIPARPGALVQRLLYDASFAVAAALTAVRVPRADVYLYVGAQPAAALATALVARIRRRPWVAKVADLAVNAATAVGMLRNPTLVRLLRTVEYATYKRADALLVLTEGFAEELTRNGLSERQAAHRSRLGRPGRSHSDDRTPGGTAAPRPRPGPPPNHPHRQHRPEARVAGRRSGGGRGSDRRVLAVCGRRPRTGIRRARRASRTHALSAVSSTSTTGRRSGRFRPGAVDPTTTGDRGSHPFKARHLHGRRPCGRSVRAHQERGRPADPQGRLRPGRRTRSARCLAWRRVGTAG